MKKNLISFFAIFMYVILLGIPNVQAADVDGTCKCGDNTAADATETFLTNDKSAMYTSLWTFLSTNCFNASKVSCSVTEGSKPLLSFTDKSPTDALTAIQSLNPNPLVSSTCKCGTAAATDANETFTASDKNAMYTKLFDYLSKCTFVKGASYATCSVTQGSTSILTFADKTPADALKAILPMKPAAPSTTPPTTPTPNTTVTSPEPNTAGTGAPAASVSTLPNYLNTTDPNVIIGRVIKFLVGISGSLALIVFIYGGFMWIISRGEASYIAKGKNAIKMAVFGLVIIFTSYIIVRLVIALFSVVG